MPTYEYRCPAGHQFELFQKISDKRRAKCPRCGRRAQRMISGGAGLVFKGSGFYITDYGKDGKGAPKPEQESSAAKSEAKTEGSESSKPKPQGETKARKKDSAGPKKGGE